MRFKSTSQPAGSQRSVVSSGRMLLMVLPAMLFVGLLAGGCSAPVNTPDYPHPGWMIIRPPEAVHCLALDGDTLWAGEENAVYRVDRLTGKVIEKLKFDPALDYIKSILVTRSHRIYIGHFNGLSFFDGFSWQTITRKDGLPDNKVNSLLEDSSGRLWVGTWGGASMAQDARWRTFTSADGLADDMVNVMFEDRDKGLWFGSYTAPKGGISRYGGENWQRFTTIEGLPHTGVTSIIQAADGTVWAGTGFSEHGGAAQFTDTGKGWQIKKTMTLRDGLAGNKVRSLVQDRDGTLWFGSEYDGLAVYKDGGPVILSEKDGMPDYEVLCMLQDPDGSMWLGTRKGILKLNYNAIKAIKNVLQ
jgi:ligand-binding sensor domain-containing protein